MVQILTLLKSSKVIISLFLIFSCIVFIQGITQIPVLDRDEARFASATKNMLESNDFIDIQLDGVPRYKKPIGIYWLQSMSSFLLSNSPYDQIWTYRLPSFFGILLSIVIIFLRIKKHFNQNIALLSSFFLTTSFLLISEMHQAKTDGVLFLCINICILYLLKYVDNYEKKIQVKIKESYKVFFWFFAGIGSLIKGPILLIFVALPLLSFSIFKKNFFLFRSIHSYFGYALYLIIVVPWFVIISKISGGSFWHESIINDLLNKVSSGQESHGFYPGYYFLLIFLLFWPGSIFLLDAIKYFFQIRKNIIKLQPKILFLICCFLPGFVFYELIPTKLPHYILPTYPALGVLISVYLLSNKNSLILKKSNYFFLLIFPITFTCIYIYANYQYTELKLSAIILSLVFIIIIFLMIDLLKKNSLRKWLIMTGTSQLIFYLSLVYSLNPNLEKFWIAQNIERFISQDENKSRNIFHSGFNEPSLVFLIGHKASRLAPDLMIEQSKNYKNNVFILTEEKNTIFLENLDEGSSIKFYNSFEGFNYSQGKFLKFFIYKD